MLSRKTNIQHLKTKIRNSIAEIQSHPWKLMRLNEVLWDQSWQPYEWNNIPRVIETIVLHKKEKKNYKFGKSSNGLHFIETIYLYKLLNSPQIKWYSKLIDIFFTANSNISWCLILVPIIPFILLFITKPWKLQWIAKICLCNPKKLLLKISYPSSQTDYENINPAT